MNAAFSVRHFQAKAAAHDAIIFLLEFIHQHEIGAIAGIVVYISCGIGISDQETIPPVAARRISDQPEADISFAGRSVFVLSADQRGMYVIHVLYINEVNGKADHAVVGGKSKRRRWVGRVIPIAFFTGEQDRTQEQNG